MNGRGQVRVGGVFLRRHIPLRVGCRSDWYWLLQLGVFEVLLQGAPGASELSLARSAGLAGEELFYSAA